METEDIIEAPLAEGAVAFMLRCHTGDELWEVPEWAVLTLTPQRARSLLQPYLRRSIPRCRYPLPNLRRIASSVSSRRWSWGCGSGVSAPNKSGCTQPWSSQPDNPTPINRTGFPTQSSAWNRSHAVRHRRVDTKPSGFVGAGGNDSPLAGLGANYHRQSTQIRMVALLDRRVEGVEVDVHDQAGHSGDDRAGANFPETRTSAFQRDASILVCVA
jgi:hypothetical protein